MHVPFFQEIIDVNRAFNSPTVCVVFGFAIFTHGRKEGK